MVYRIEVNLMPIRSPYQHYADHSAPIYTIQLFAVEINPNADMDGASARARIGCGPGVPVPLRYRAQRRRVAPEPGAQCPGGFLRADSRPLVRGARRSGESRNSGPSSVVRRRRGRGNCSWGRSQAWGRPQVESGPGTISQQICPPGAGNCCPPFPS